MIAECEECPAAIPPPDLGVARDAAGRDRPSWVECPFGWSLASPPMVELGVEAIEGVRHRNAPGCVEVSELLGRVP